MRLSSLIAASGLLLSSHISVAAELTVRIFVDEA